MKHLSTKSLFACLRIEKDEKVVGLIIKELSKRGMNVSHVKKETK